MAYQFPSFTNEWHTTMYPAIDSSNPSLSANGKSIVITGGGTGIGAATAYHFARAGATSVTILGRRENRLIETKTRLQTRFPHVEFLHFCTDIIDKDQVDKAFEYIHASVGDIHVLINNAGYMSDPGSIKDSEPNEWWKVLEINVKGSFNVVKAFLRHNHKNAIVVNVSSVLAHLAIAPDYSSYRTSKAGGTIFFDSVQQENPELRVVNLQPGVVATEMSAKSGYPSLDDSSLPASFIVWLATPEASFLKGKFVWANWDVDEMKEKAEEIEGSNLLTMGLIGWPFQA